MARVLTVSQFIELVRGVLRETFQAVTVQGEVTGYRMRRDNLVYFELKDSASRVLCFGLRHEVRHTLQDGMEVKVTGAPTLFKGNGGFHLRVIDVELVGEGALKQAFEATKRRLESEGLFRPERKRPLPEFPNVIGLVTSPDAAAYRDVLRILRNRWPLVQVKLAAVAVQGAGAAGQIARALNFFSTSASVEVVILARGGGSMEDLQAFNDEGVARAIYASRVPVVVGVGHEQDVTIADFVADRRAATPSNGAELTVPDRTEVLHRLEVAVGRMFRSLAATLETEHQAMSGLMQQISRGVTGQVHAVALGLRSFMGTTAALRGRIAASGSSVAAQEAFWQQRWNGLFGRRQAALDALTQRLQALSPTAILKRGYSLTRLSDGRIVRTSRTLRPGQSISTTFGSGSASSTVREVS